MKKYWFFLILPIAYVCWMAWLLSLDNFEHSKKRRMDLAESSFEYGCYTEANSECGLMTDTLMRGFCWDGAFTNCPRWAKRFRKHLERGLK